MEIERKFLVEQRPPAIAFTSAALRQGYLLIADDGEVRVRDAGGVYSLTVKSRGSLSREEHEVELTRDQFEALWPATLGRRVEKTRHEFTLGGMDAALDVFEGDLDGLVTVEVEFPSVSAARAFVPPAWFGPEVTEDASYKNASLAVHGQPGETPGARA
ncbi:MAG: CYTH domain-containing protein [Anaerosomatales bacterium]